MKKRIALLLTTVVCVVCMNNSVKAAWDWSQERLSPAGMAGTLFYGPEISMVWDLNTYSFICGGDVQAHLMQGTQGMQDGFVHSGLRQVYTYLNENDSGSSATARIYGANFIVDSSGRYRPGTWELTYTNAGQIEADGKAELQLSINVSTCYGDTTSSVPSNIFSYRIGIID